MLGTFVAEGLLYLVPLFWRFRRLLAVCIMIYIAVTTYWLVLHLGWAAGIPVFGLAVFRIGNLARILKARMNQYYLRHAVARTTIWLLMYYVFMTYLFAVPISATLSKQFVLNSVMAVQLLVAGGLLAITFLNLRKLQFRVPSQHLSDKELPTVTVAIPARNETTDLEECLRSVLANDYPKLEVIVLDDCSQGRTADIIRSFAQDGVRFVQGEEPAERWLAKNQAYEKLYQEATGDLVLFCGVDVRFGPRAIRSMVDVLRARNKSMLSVLPVRTRSTALAAFIQPMRYWWELSLPRRLFNRPPVLSTCWLINRDRLKHLGGFASVSHTILPEGVYARELVKTDSYSFIRSGGELEVETVKSLSEQRATAVRMRYPQIRRRPEWALLLILAELALLLLPFILLLASVWQPHIDPILPAITCVLLIASHLLIVQATNPSNIPLAVFNFPLVILTEVLIGVISMTKYEFGTVTWKDRNICIPVMHVVPKLPNSEI
jgi:hypothetical protein